MIGRKATVGLSLLCALLFSAIAVGSASAAAGNNITAFSCTKGSGTQPFKDAHCDEAKTTENGYKHNSIGPSTEIDVTALNSQVLKAEPFGVKATITCTTLKGSGTVSNSEPSAGVHKLTGSGTLEYTGCTVTEVAKCTKVYEPVIAKIGSVDTQEGLVGPKGELNAMGLEVRPELFKPFAEVTLEGTCAIATKPFPVEGSVILTNGPAAGAAQNKKHSGATAVVEAGNGMTSLKAGGKTATYSGIATYTMKGGADDGAAITTTTVT